MDTTYLYLVSMVSVFFGIYIIISKNPIVSVLFLIGLFSSIAVYLIMLGLHFIGLSYLLVYVGAVSILFLFILMLINVRISELLTDNNNSIPLGVLTILCFSYCAGDITPYGIAVYDTFSNYTFNVLTTTPYTAQLSYDSSTLSDNAVSVFHYFSAVAVASVSSKSWDSMLTVSSHITSIGNILYTNLFILFIITSLILLLAMIGAIVITINKPSNTRVRARS